MIGPEPIINTLLISSRRGIIVDLLRNLNFETAYNIKNQFGKELLLRIKNILSHPLYLYMKKFIFIFLLYIIPFSLFSQKVTVQVIKVGNAAKSDWQILDEKYNVVFSGYEYFRNDSVTISLDAQKRYFLKITVSEIYDRNANLYTLILNGEPIILVKSDIDPGDHSFPFFTGIRNGEVKIMGGTNALISDFP